LCAACRLSRATQPRGGGFAAISGPLTPVRDGDRVRINIANGRIDLIAGEDELNARRAAWRPPVPRRKSGLLAKYGRLVGQANLGPVTHEGGSEWPWFDH
jgi:dihydroxy-acid dehydratase